MKNRYLEVTFRNGKAIAAYLHLAHRQGDQSARTRDVGGSLLIDYTEDGRAIGIEILSPTTTGIDALNRVLSEINEQPLTHDEARPLAA
jgi:uncharacterized protein YuzE